MAKRIRKFKSNFTVVHNEFLDDKELKNAPVGLLMRMLRLPSNWRFSVKFLMKMCNEGERAITSQLNVLEKNKYVVRICKRSANGRISDWEYIISDEHLPEELVILGIYYRKKYKNMADAQKPLLHYADVEAADMQNVDTYQIYNDQVNNDQIYLSCQSEDNCNYAAEDEEQIYGNTTDEIKEENTAVVHEREELREQLGVDKLIEDNPDYSEQLNELLGIVADTLDDKRNKLRISGRQVTHSDIMVKYSKLRSEHIIHVIDSYNAQLRKGNKPKNPTAYIRTMLYNTVNECEQRRSSAFDTAVPDNNYGFMMSDDTCPGFTLEDLMSLANRFDDIA